MSPFVFVIAGSGIRRIERDQKEGSNPYEPVSSREAGGRAVPYWLRLPAARSWFGGGTGKGLRRNGKDWGGIGKGLGRIVGV